MRSPETKGKDEVSNKYAQWLRAYDNKVDDVNHLISIINALNIEINKQVNTRTYKPPILLFQKEKEYLKPLPNTRLLENYDEKLRSIKIPSTFVITYKGSKYSVPPNFINKVVYYKVDGNKLYVYHNNCLIASHNIFEEKGVYYNEQHYKDGLLGKFKNDDSIEEYKCKNLENLKNMKDKYVKLHKNTQ